MWQPVGYWRRRLEGRHYDVIQSRDGHATKAPEMLVEFRGLCRGLDFALWRFFAVAWRKECANLLPPCF